MKNWIKTGNDFADWMFFTRFFEDPVLVALVDYLEAQGVLNKVEFARFVNEQCQKDVGAREQVSHEDG